MVREGTYPEARIWGFLVPVIPSGWFEEITKCSVSIFPGSSIFPGIQLSTWGHHWRKPEKSQLKPVMAAIMNLRWPRAHYNYKIPSSGRSLDAIFWTCNAWRVMTCYCTCAHSAPPLTCYDKNFHHEHTLIWQGKSTEGPHFGEAHFGNYSLWFPYLLQINFVLCDNCSWCVIWIFAHQEANPSSAR